MEAIVATVIAVLAVIALAYSFGYGRSFINGFEVRRVAEGAAQACMDSLGTLPDSAAGLALGTHPATPLPFACNGRVVGTVSWRVSNPSDVPATVAGALRELKVAVAWMQENMRDSVVYTRVVAAP
jgi:hypothetical protein